MCFCKNFHAEYLRRRIHDENEVSLKGMMLIQGMEEVYQIEIACKKSESLLFFDCHQRNSSFHDWWLSIFMIISKAREKFNWKNYFTCQQQ